MPEKIKSRVAAGWAVRLAAALLVLAVLFGAAAPALAQNLVYSVPEATADLYVNEDGTVSIEYTYVFENSTRGDPIDIVDIGMPTDSYDLSSISATIDGRPATRIAESEFVDPGVEIHLGQGTIRPGQSGTLVLRVGKVERMLFHAKTDEQEPYASFQYQPNYFGSVEGRTNMTVTLHLPEGLEPEEPRYFTPQGWPGSDDPEAGYDEQGRVFYRWTTANADASAKYTFGSAFPARLVPENALLTEAPFDLEMLCPILFCLGLGGFIVLTIYGSIAADRKRRLQYLPPKVSVEGNGIKRGLTPVEAAILMQQPMDKILTMILFSVVKKGAVTVVSRDPMKLQVAKPLPEDLRPYELAFANAMAQEKPSTQRRELQDMMAALVQSISEKMRGFSRKETVTYYQDIMNKAWQQVEAAETPEVKMQAFDEAMDWTMLDKRFPDRTREVFGPRPVVFAPAWWGRFDPAASSAGTGIPGPVINTSGNKPPQGVNLPNLPGSDFAASMVAGMQSFASDVVGDVTNFTGGVTEKTNPVPKVTSSGGRSGGGGGGRSCACACACAGCACACAGGGR